MLLALNTFRRNTNRTLGFRSMSSYMGNRWLVRELSTFRRFAGKGLHGGIKAREAIMA